MEIVFDNKGTFEAMYAAQRWCKDNGISYGSSCVSGPVGLLRGDYCIAKWHNLNQKERAQLDGILSGDMREGPVKINLKEAQMADGLKGDKDAKL